MMGLWYLTAWRKIFTWTEQGELWLASKFVQVVVAVSLRIVKLLRAIRSKSGTTTEKDVNRVVSRIMEVRHLTAYGKVVVGFFSCGLALEEDSAVT